MKINPNDSVRLPLFGFCCRAKRKAPMVNSKFKMFDFSNNRLAMLSRYLSKNNHELQAVQHAIWAVSDGYSLASIVESNVLNQKALRDEVARILQTESPWYSVVFKRDSTLCSGKPERLTADFDYQVINNSFVDLMFVDQLGNPLKVFFKYTPHNPDRYIYKVDFDVSNYPSGKYYFKMYYDGVLKKSRPVSL